MDTLKNLMIKTVDSMGTSTYINYKDNGRWQKKTFSEFQRNVEVISEIIDLFKVKEGKTVGLFMENGHIWPEIYMGIVSANTIAVPIDAKLMEKEVSHIMIDSEVSLIFTQRKLVHTLKESLPKLSKLQHVIVVDTNMDEAELGVKFHSYPKLINQAREHFFKVKNTRFELSDPKPDDIASIIYTSGTTGRSKGAMLSHNNFASQYYSVIDRVDISKDDNLLTVLPLHHAFSFTVNLVLTMSIGCQTSYVESLRTISDNIKEIKPTALVGVPLLFDKMKDKIMLQLKQNKVGSFLYTVGIRGPVKKKIRQGFGGKMRLLVSGGAPADPETLKWYDSLGIKAIEGYGLTETAPVMTVSSADAAKYGTVGPALLDVEIRIHQPNENNIGEIQTKGPNVFKGYFKNQAATDEVLSEDGWLSTGDLGMFDEDNYLKICGRKKCLIVNREGKNIYPEEVENHISHNEFVSEVLVLGFKEEDEVGEKVGAIIVPDNEKLDKWQAQHHHKYLSDKELEEFIFKQIKDECKDLSSYKRPRKVVIRYEEFEKTSTMKIKRYLYNL
ncbi:MAG: AMP-binding protein [Kiritimatiellae bacterium]|jgi:long-chain acyl-CoA synthetase|nr:AMP-binding protein [Kiritimatiellia bacterium]